MKDKIQDSLNQQINAELHSAYIYLSMAAYFESISLKGFANWMRVQAMEEEVHAIMIFDYINGRNGRVKLKPIEAPPVEWKSSLDVFQAAYKHEQHVTGLINNLVDLAHDEKDHATYNFLQWFIAEQVEEEASADAVVQKLKLVGDQGDGIFMIDRELANRTFVMPATAKTANAQQ